MLRSSDAPARKDALAHAVLAYDAMVKNRRLHPPSRYRADESEAAPVVVSAAAVDARKYTERQPVADLSAKRAVAR